MKNFAHFFCIVWALLSCTYGQAQMQLHPEEISDTDRAWIERNMDEYMEENAIPALAIGIVKNGQVAAFISKGRMKKGSKVAVSEHTVFQLASLTKSFTGILTNHLIDEGKIDIAQSIITYLPNSLSAETKEKLAPVKVYHLLHHRSGIPRDALNGPNTPFGLPMKGGYTEEELLENLELISLRFEPGDRFEYSNFGFSLMGYLLAQASGMSYDELVQKYIANPYNMSCTTTELSEEQQQQLATPYRPEWPFIKTKPWEFGLLAPAGGMYSSVSDLAKLMSAQMKAYEQFYQNDQTHPLILTAQKQKMGRGFYGFGFMENKSSIDSTITHFGHGGDIDGFVSNYSFSPEKNIGLIMLSSKGGRWFWELEVQINKRLLGFPTPDAIQLDKGMLKKYVGEYQFKDVLLRIELKNNQLWTQTPNASKQKLYAASETAFFYKAFDAQFKFMLDDKGEIEKILYTQNGKSTEPEKVK